MPLQLRVLPEIEQLFVEADGTTWRRTGHCCQCGSCCVGNPETGDPLELCPQFRPHDDQVGGTCATHGGDYWYYRAACAAWPGHPSAIAQHAECTYRFERVNGL